MDPHTILLDPRYVVPIVEPAPTGVAWLRATVARFSEGVDHARRRAVVEDLLAGVDLPALARAGDHVATLAAALGLPRSVTRDVRLVVACYQPHVTVTAAADAAVTRLVDACGGTWDERTANRVGILVQACDATAALAAGTMPPVPATTRIAPDGSAVRVPLDEVPFGAGRHACPGRAHAEALVTGMQRFHRLHHGPEPLVLPNAWDAASAALFADAGFAAVGTTSLGVAAAAGVEDAAGRARDATLRLAATIARLPVPVSIDVEDGWGAGHAEVAAALAEMGAAGVNVEDGRGRGLAPADEAAAVVAAMKAAAPTLFVNARVDTHWVGAERDSTVERARRYVDAGADGIFVPGLDTEDEIERLATAVPVPLNVLAGRPIGRLRDLGVRRISTGSLLYRHALGAALGAAVAVRDGGGLAPPADQGPLSYGRVNGLAATWTDG